MLAQQKVVLRGYSDFALRQMIARRFNMHHGLIFVGACGFFTTSPEVQVLTIDYAVFGPHQGRGFATQAVGLLCKWAFEELLISRVLAKVRKDNIGSQIVLGRNGFAVYGEGSEIYYCEKFNPKIPRTD